MTQSTCPRCNQSCPANEMNAYGGHEDCDIQTPRTPLIVNYTNDELAIMSTLDQVHESKSEREGKAKTYGRKATKVLRAGKKNHGSINRNSS